MTLDDCGQSSWWAAPGNQGPCGWAIRIERIRRHRTVPSSVVAGGDSAVAIMGGRTDGAWGSGLNPGRTRSVLLATEVASLKYS